MNSAANQKDLVLIGGGHSHALALRMWAMQPLSGVRVTLISPQTDTPYSGMLPGLIAGNYQFDETHIDLARLCKFSGARFIQAEVIAVDTDAKTVQLPNRPPLGFDLLSINSGIAPDLSVPGAQEYALPVKPIAGFYPRWRKLLAALQNQQPGSQAHRLLVVGGGAAAVELAFAMHCAFTSDVRISVMPAITIVHPGTALPEHYPARLQKLTRKKLCEHGIQIVDRARVTTVTAGEISVSGSGAQPNGTLTFDTLVWSTHAAASDWPARAGIAIKDGFIAVNDALQSESHDFIFAAGDIAVQRNQPRPRAGVFAVRQAKTLYTNWHRQLLGQSLQQFKPQRAYLSLLAFGREFAAGCRRNSLLPSFSGRWVWHWKDRIDRRFMAQFESLPSPMPARAEASPSLPDSGDAMHCGGCGAKVGADVLERVLNSVRPVSSSDVISGLAQRGDASIIKISAGHLLVQSVDQFRTLLDDPWLLGKICAEHALSDLFAMFATPHSAQALITLPWAAEALTERDLLQILLGANAVFEDHGCALLGGHTSEGAELSVGFAVNGTVSESVPASTAAAGDSVIITKALGTGTLFAAHEQLRAKGRDIEAAIASMTQSNRTAAEILQAHHASACTDITGFGFAGHLQRLLAGQKLNAEVHIKLMPTLPGALAALEQGLASSLQPKNLRFGNIVAGTPAITATAAYQLLFDPQTSGGLLACVPAASAADCVSALRDAGYPAAVALGTLSSHGEGKLILSE